MLSRHLIPRRTCLKGLGIAMALPLLETMSWGETPRKNNGQPVRMAFLYSSFGVHPPGFYAKDVKTFGPSGILPPTLEPLRPVLGDCLVLDGVMNPGVRLEKGQSSHLTETGAWLTATRPKGPGKMEVGVSADQIAAQQIGSLTAIPSLELGVMPSNFSYVGEDGYSGQYYETVSYRTPTQALPVESSPRAVLNRLFSSRKSMPRRPSGGTSGGSTRPSGAGGAAVEEGPSLDQSMLDVVRSSNADLRKLISGQDQRTLDEYLDGVRALEQRVVAIERQQAEAARERQSGSSARKTQKFSPPIEVTVKEGDIPWSEHVRLLCDLTILAFQTDLTRVVTIMLEHPFGLSYPELGFSDKHHALSHHDGDQAKIEKLLKVERFQIEQFAYLISRMKGLMDGNGSLLDNSILMWGSGMGDGFKHNNDNLPTIIAGRGGGTVRTGRYVRTTTSQGDLLLGILQRAGVSVTALGNGTKPAADLS